MKKILLVTLIGLFASISSFAISGISGTRHVCVGGTTFLFDSTLGGVWSSSNPAIATIGSLTGVVTGISPGLDTITYHDSLGTAIAVITVNPLPGPISGSPHLCVGQTTTLTDSSSPGGVWSTGSSHVSVGSSSGVVTGLSSGTAVITYTSTAGCSATFTLTVNPGPVPISGPSTVLTGGTITLTDATTGGIWSSSTPSVGTINPTSGVVTGISAGVTIITYQILGGGCFVTKVVTDSAGATIAPISGASTVCVGSTILLTDSTAGGTWSSSNTAIATVTSGGVVTGVSSGVATITYTVGTGFVTHTVSVNPVASISGPGGICIGSSITLSGSPTGGSWASGNVTIATVTSGVVNGLSAGVVNIYYAVGGCYAYHTVTVSAVPAAITGTTTVSTGGTTTLSDAVSGGTWTSSNTAIATINAAGVVTGVSAGTCTITYSTGGCYVTTTVTVTGGTSISAITGASSLCVGATTTLADATPGGSWSSSNIGIATVSSAGIVTGLSAGTVTITYTVGAGNVTKSLTVNPSPAAITGTATTSVGSSVTLTDVVAGGTWSSSNTTIATVNPTSGLVTGVSAGTCTITYMLPAGCYTTTTFTVTGGGSTIGTITGASSVCVGATIALADSTAGGSWSSSNTAIATVSSTGVVTGVAAGTVTITYTAGALHATATITVNPLPAAITGTTTVSVGSTTTLADAVGGGVWSSSNPAIATVNTLTGVVTGVSAGTCTITYTLPTGCFTTTTVTVTGTSSAGSISGASTVCVGSTTVLTDSIPGGTWTSSNPGIATVSSAGVVTGISAGVVTITYTVGASTATKSITVNAAPASISGSTTVSTGSTITLTDATAGGSWSSSNTAVATVNATSGVVTGISAGTAIITYTLPDGCAVHITVTVTGSSSISPISGPSVVCAGNIIALTDSTPGGTWSSSNTAIATVTSTGIVSGIAAGTVTITYTVGASHVTKSVTVITGATISGAGTVCSGSAITLTGSVSGGTWTSGNTAIATVGSTGVVTGVTTGVVNIYYNIGGCYAYHTVTVTASPSISGSGTLCPGATITLTGSPAGGSWSSSNPAIATVSSAGVVSAMGTGVVNISYTAGGCAAYKSVTVNGTATISGSSSLCRGTTTTLTGSPSGGSWSSSNLAVATVSSAGVVTAVGAGIANIYYSVDGCGAYHIVTVNATATISGGSTVCSGSTISLSATPSGGTWSSSSAAIATVGTTGVVTGVSAGAANISYSTGGCSAYHTVTVNAAATISGSGSVCIGTATTLTASISGGRWSSSNTAIATVGTSTGVVTGIASGVVTIYYLSGSCYSSYSVTVNAAASVSGASSVCVGGTAALTATPPGGTWTSGNTAIATVSTSGVVTGIGAGIVNIYYNSGGCSAYHTVTVNAASATISGASSLCAGTTATLVGTPSGGTWSSSFTVSATIGSASGIISGISAGTSTIYYSVGGCYAYRVETVNPVPAAIVGASSVCTGSYITLSDPTAGGTWSSSNTSIATVTSAGVVVGVSAGIATISYSAGACSITRPVTVNLTPAAIAGPTSVLTGYAITLTDAVAGGTWLSGNTGIATVNPITGVVTGVSAGTVNIYYSIGGCSTYITITVSNVPMRPGYSSGTTATHVIAGEENTIKIYPNPTAGNLHIQWDGQANGTANVAITDVTGRQVYSTSLEINATAGQQQIDLGSLKNGIYFINIKSDNINYTDKLMIAK